MKLRNRMQKVAVCGTLIRRGIATRHPNELFRGEQVTQFAYGCLRKSSPLDPDDTTIVRVMLAVWNNTDLATVLDVLTLDPDRRRLVCSLLVALAESHDAVDRWLDDQRDDPPVGTGRCLPELPLSGTATAG